MKKISASQQKLLKSIHLLAIAVWLSCVILLALMPVLSSRISTGDELYMYNLIYHFIDMDVLTPAAILTLVTGLVYSIFTRWGFFKHGWLIYKWVVTLGIIVIGTFYLGPMVDNLLEISDHQRMVALDDPYYTHGIRVGLWAGVINSVLLVFAVAFSVFKPWKNLKK